MSPRPFEGRLSQVLTRFVYGAFPQEGIGNLVVVEVSPDLLQQGLGRA
jgi:hypothetical protein